MTNMDEHKQYNLERKAEAKDDFVSSPNLVYTDKDLNVKETFFVNDTEESSLTGQRVGVKRVSDSYTALRQDYYIGCSHSTTITITLPPVSLAQEGRVYEIKDESGGASTNTITIDGNGSETIDGSATQTINSNYGFYKLIVSNGAWYSAIPSSSSSGLSLLGSGTFNSTATTANFTADDTTDILTSAGHNLSEGDKIYFTTTGTLPAGLSTGIAYYVRGATTDTFRVTQLIPFDTTVDITDTGTGVHTWTNAQGSIRVTFTAKDNLVIVLSPIAVTAASTLGFNFNNDGAASYGYAATKNGAAAGVQSATKSILVDGGVTFSSDHYSNISITNRALYRKSGVFSSFASGGTTSGDIIQGGLFYNNTTDQITSILVYLGSGFDNGFGTGSMVYVYGVN